MKKLYEKNELTFAIMWIVVYCVLQSLANPINEWLGIQYAASAVFCLAQALVLLVFLKQNGLMNRYGLCTAALPARKFLYYLPLLFLVTRNLWNGTAINLPLIDMAYYLLCMLCVGFVEEVIFRGLLFKAMARDNVKSAVIVSSITFGLGHLINLVNGSGAGLAENLFQVTGAIAIGFLFVILFARGGSLLPCIIAHAIINMSSVFANEMGLTVERRLLFHAVLLAVTVGYSLILLKTVPKKEISCEE